MDSKDRTILELVVKNAVLEAFKEHHTEVITPLNTRLTSVEGDIRFARRCSIFAWGVITTVLSYIGLK